MLVACVCPCWREVSWRPFPPPAAPSGRNLKPFHSARQLDRALVREQGPPWFRTLRVFWECFWTLRGPLYENMLVLAPGSKREEMRTYKTVHRTYQTVNGTCKTVNGRSKTVNGILTVLARTQVVHLGPLHGPCGGPCTRTCWSWSPARSVRGCARGGRPDCCAARPVAGTPSARSACIYSLSPSIYHK